ncbi:MAG: hypothetical protein Q8K30_07140 [Candidatus Gracilibacteria bacterium]|nr:hypothetical protein [Candidatus Gracilibacteria bacterium]
MTTKLNIIDDSNIAKIDTIPLDSNGNDTNHQVLDILSSGVNINHQKIEGLSQDEIDFFHSKDLGNIYSAGSNSREVFYPLVKYVYNQLKSANINIHNNQDLIDKLLSGDCEKLHHVFRWGGFCFTEIQQNEMKALVENGDFTKESWSKYLDEDGKIRGRVVGDGDVFEHQLGQSRLISEYSKYDLLNIVPSSNNLESEGIVFTVKDYCCLQVLGLVHDAGELGNGDVLYDNKVVNDVRAHEKQSGVEIINSMNIPDELKSSILEIYDIDFDKNHYLKALFSYYEKMSYVTGAINTFNLVGTDKEIMESKGLIHNVLKNQIIPMIDIAKGGVDSFRLRSMHQFLLANADNITKMFEFISETNYKTGKIEDDNKMELAYEVWQLFKQDFIKNQN